jgi:hypothetical protein
MVSIEEFPSPWQCSGGMQAIEWRLLTTLTDLPSAHVLAGMLSGNGIAVRIASDAGVLGQAAPSRVYVAAAQLHRARWLLAQCELTDEELAPLPGGEAPADPDARAPTVPGGSRGKT